MCNSKTTNRSQDTSILSLLGIVFITLKLCGVIDWSWWWVTAPFWIPFAILLVTVIIILIIALFLYIYDWLYKKPKQYYNTGNTSSPTWSDSPPPPPGDYDDPTDH